MKTSQLAVLVFLSGLLLSASCKKHVVPPQSELSKLPPATQTGANTFGCLVNGQAFLPGGSVVTSHLQCNYIYTAGGYHFTVAADNKTGNNVIKNVIIGTDSLMIAQGQTFAFKPFIAGNALALFISIDNSGNQNEYATTNSVSGQLIITKLDEVNQIVSGTFYFNAINSAKDTVKVTDGRFDMHYTR